MIAAQATIADPETGSAEFRRGWKIVLASMLGIGLGLSPLPIYTLGVFAPHLRAEFGWSVAEIMGALSMTTLVVVFIGPLIGWLVGRVGVRPIVLISLLLFGIGMLSLSLLTGSLALYYLIWALIAVVGAGTLPITFTRTVNQWFDARKGLALGLSMMGTGLFGIFSKPYVTWAIEAFGWRGAFIALGILPLAIALPAAWFLFHDEAPEKASGAPARMPGGLTLRQALREWRFWLLAAAVMPLSFALAGPVPNMEAILQTAGVAPEHLLRLTPLIGLSALLGRIVGGWLLDRFWAPAVGTFLLSLPAISCFILMRGELGQAEAAFAIFLIGFALGIEYDLVAYLVCRYFGLKSYAAIYGILYVSFAFGAGFGPLLFGRDYDLHGNFGLALSAAAVILLVSASSLLLLGRYRHFPDEAPTLEK